ncbi:MAG: hypothetical protein QM767_30390 [Anaeromyxobacter sp.]
MLLFAGLALAIAAGGVAFERQTTEARREETERKVAAIARLQADAIGAWRAERVRAAVGLASTIEALVDLPALGRTGLAADGVRADLTLAFAAYQRERRADLAAVVDAGGLPLAGTAQDLRPVLSAGLPGAPLATDVTLPGGGLGLQVTVPLQARAPAAALVVRFDAAREVLPFLRGWPGATASGQLLLVRRSRGQAVTFGAGASAAELSSRLPGGSLLDGLTAAAATGRPDVVRGLDDRGVEVIAAAHPVPGSPWTVLARVDAAETEGAERTLGALTLMAALGLVAATGAGLRLWSRRDRVRTLERAWSAERRARLLRDEQARLVELVGEPVVLLDPEQRVRFWNPAAERLLRPPAGRGHRPRPGRAAGGAPRRRSGGAAPPARAASLHDRAAALPPRRRAAGGGGHGGGPAGRGGRRGRAPARPPRPDRAPARGGLAAGAQGAAGREPIAWRRWAWWPPAWRTRWPRRWATP